MKLTLSGLCGREWLFRGGEGGRFWAGEGGRMLFLQLWVRGGGDVGGGLWAWLRGGAFELEGSGIFWFRKWSLLSINQCHCFSSKASLIQHFSEPTSSMS